MDPITHAAIGLTISKFAGNGIDLSNAANIGIVIGSVFPDIDILMQRWGDYAYLKNHRGVTHSILGLFISSLLISGSIMLFFRDADFISTFLYTFLGCLSHSFFDLFNSYGAKLLWPFYKKKFTLDLMMSFDPILLVALVGSIFVKGIYSNLLILIFASYIILRTAARIYIYKSLKSMFAKEYEKISILPSLKSLFKWHFVLETSDHNIIGTVSFIKRKITVIDRLQKIDDNLLDKALYSPVGKLFKEFTPLYHVKCERNHGKIRYVYTDMRYYIRNDFLHHAVLEVDENESLISASFNPYSMNRCNILPVNKLKEQYEA